MRKQEIGNTKEPIYEVERKSSAVKRLMGYAAAVTGLAGKPWEEKK